MSNINEAINEAIEACQDTKDNDTNDLIKLHNYNACDWLYELLDEYVSEHKSIKLRVLDVPPDIFININITHIGNLFDNTWISYNTISSLNLNSIVEVIE